MSTLSNEWVTQVSRTPTFTSVRWDNQLPVEVTTLDALIARYGLPHFCKLDIEGSEYEALLGLSQPIPTLSFEFLPMALDRARACIERLRALGAYEFNYIKGEYPRFATERWLPADEVRRQLAGLPDDGRAGEVYARLGG